MLPQFSLTGIYNHLATKRVVMATVGKRSDSDGASWLILIARVALDVAHKWSLPATDHQEWGAVGRSVSGRALSA